MTVLVSLRRIRKGGKVRVNAATLPEALVMVQSFLPHPEYWPASITTMMLEAAASIRFGKAYPIEISYSDQRAYITRLGEDL